MDNAQGYGMGYTSLEALVENRLVTYASTGVEYADAITERVIGITTQAVASGARASVQVDGVAFCVADGSGAAIVPGARLMPKASADGVAVVAAGATAIPCAIALEGTTAAAGVIRVLLTPNQAVVGS